MTEIELYDLVLKNVKNKKPFSVVRCGDGEMFVMKSLDKKSNTDIENVPFIKHIGFIPSKDEKLIIINNIKKTIENADVVGITNNVGSKWSETKNYFKEMIGKDKKTVSADFHHVWTKNGLLIDLLKNIDDLFYISGHELDKTFISLGINNVNSIIIPKQVKYFGIQSENHFPNRYFDVIDKLNKMDLTGKLCLVGAGFIGKYYVDLIKNSGGVAIDIGSAFDMISGYKTRGTRGKLIIDEKYKI